MDLRFTFERLLLRGLHYRLLFAAAIIATVSVVAGVLVVLLDPRFEDTAAGIWWSFLRLSDPGYLGDDEGAVSVTISTVITVLGYVLFLGLLVAILTQWMNGLIAEVEAGTTRVRFKNHILILGWTHRTPSIVLELLETKGRAVRFLQGTGARDLRIVILAEQVDAELRDELKSSLGKHWDDRRVVLRSGSPLKLDSLERVAYYDAAAAILPGADFAAALPGVADSEIIKTLAVMSAAGGQAGRVPLAVAALYNANRGEVASRAYAGKLEIVAADHRVARMIAQSITQPGLWPIYWELLNLLEENSVFVRQLTAGCPATISEARASCSDAVVIGVSREGDRRSILNPPGDTRIGEGDSVIFIAKHYSDCVFEHTPPPAGRSELAEWTSAESDIQTLLVLGWSRLVPGIIAELLDSRHPPRQIDVAGIVPISEREMVHDSVINAMRDGTVRHIEYNFMDPDEAADMHPENYDAILMIARERMVREAVADAATLSAYLTMQTLIDDANKPHIVAEILDPENERLFDPSLVDVVVSPMIASYILSQVALEPELGQVLHEVTRSGGVRIRFRALESGSIVGDCSFAQLAEHAAARGETAIGVVTLTEGRRQTHLNPGAGAQWACEQIEQVIVLG